jgi:hypothetical protein
LRDYGAAVDAAGSWGVPEGSGVGEHVLGKCMSAYGMLGI